jgi:2-keto-3-deoxy-L-fuconate dehydrogenase
MHQPEDSRTMRFKDQVAIITGGASGIGRAAAALFIAAGARVAIVDRDVEALDGLAGALGTDGETLRTYAADVTDDAATSRAAADIEATWGRVDVLVTAAGISVGKPAGETTMAEWRRVIDVNLGGTFCWVHAVLPAMVARGAGAIVTIGSQLSTAGGTSNAAYVASKGAISSLTRSVALDYAAAGIRCNSVSPGATETPLLRTALARKCEPDDARQKLIARHAMGRIGEPREIASAILYLASPEASFITGSQLVVDGGWLVA